MSGPVPITEQQLSRSLRLYDIAELFYRLFLLSDTARLADLPPRARQRFIHAAEHGWDYLQHGEPPL